MLTRRENLLIRPWQQRRFNSHKEKVKSAKAVIDSGPPKERGHVTLKLKKLQFEEERTEKIEKDNIRLLQRMAAIMSTSRLDNRWLTDPPGGFLGRIGIYGPVLGHRRLSDECLKFPDIHERKSECTACRIKEMQKEYEQLKSKKEFLKKGQSTICFKESETAAVVKRERPKSAKGKTRKSAHPSKYKTKPVVRLRPLSGNKVVFTRGPLEVSVSYPNNTQVVLKRIGDAPKIIDSEFCECKALQNL
ncbi:Hypothetical predicted protein [Cloeon dipterum]|uniref:Uncharacterized protein n=2 Tax=Cloeon dipterum TaxID=197152 RepID=A0A8S1C7T0_9INSE|nr:Hypothetical predicted protein [Cloeon dipterum]